MKDKQKFFGIVLLVLMVLGMGYGIWKVNFAPKSPAPAPDPAPVEVTDPAADPVQEPEPITTDDPNAVPVTEPDPQPEPPQEQPAAPVQGGSENSGEEPSPVPDGYVYVPGFGYMPPPGSGGGGGELPDIPGSTLPEGVDPNGHTGSF